MIKYKYVTATNIQVLLDGKITGNIVQKDNGFQYVPKGQKNGGDILPTIQQVKQSIENEPS